MIKQVKGNQVFLDGEAFYKIQNYDCMDDFFMTITSSSDVWNFLWAQGGITAGRKNCDFSIFPYYTCDKIQDTKSSTGSVTIVKVKNEGKIEASIENAKTMLRLGKLSLEEIAVCSGLSIEKVRELAGNKSA